MSRTSLHHFAARLRNPGNILRQIEHLREFIIAERIVGVGAALAIRQRFASGGHEQLHHQ